MADEVRKLAEQSSDSAKQIENLITQVMGTTNHTVHMMGKVDNEVQAGTQVVMHTEKHLEQLQKKYSKYLSKFKRYLCLQMKLQRVVRKSRLLQKTWLKFPKRSSDRTDRVKESIQQQEKSVQEISVSIEHMHNAAGKLKQIVAQFTLQK